MLDPSNSNIALRGELSAAPQRLLLQRRRTGQRHLEERPTPARRWTKLTGNGLPPGTYGRIALDVSRSNPNVVYAQVEAGETGTPERTACRRGRRGDRSDAGGRRGGDAAGSGRSGWPGGRARRARGAGQPGAAARRSRKPADAADRRSTGATTPVRRNGYLPAGRWRRWAREQQPPPGWTPPALDPKKGGVLRSDNKGRRGRSSATATRGRCISASSASTRSNDKTIYVAGLPVAKSLDGGKTFATLDEAGGNGEPGHVDQHAIWIDPKNPKHIMVGNDGGLDISWDQGKSWDYVNTMATALAYVVTADMRHPYYVYIGLQDNGSWGGPSATAAAAAS